MSWRRRADGLIVLVCAVVGILAALSASAAAARPAFEDFLADLWPEAQARGITRNTFDDAFKGLTPDLKLPDLILSASQAKPTGSQAEFVKPPSDYLSERSLNALARRGQRLARLHAPALRDIESTHGVPRHVLLAIWGRETAFSQYRLRHDAIRAMATQAYVGRRKDYFRNELILALRILQERHVPRSKMRSSWAGALGATQFMPSNFYDHAVDQDNDGRRDIWDSVPDALASTAKSLADNGWVRALPWGHEATKPRAFDCSLEGPGHRRTIAWWQAQGFRPALKLGFSDRELRQEAYLLLPEGALGPAFLMTANFLVIKSYNFSDLYALFVSTLSERIAGRGGFATPWATSSQLPTVLVKELQTHLNTLGFEAGKVDGFIGTGTRSAIGRFQKDAGLPLDCFPSRATLDAARSKVTSGTSE